MFLSKIWFVLVGLAAGVATTAAFVAPRSADRRIVGLEGERLDRAQYAAEQMLKADAHSWIDYVAKLSRDANLAESLDAASRNAGEPRLLHETVQGRLKTLVPNLVGIGLVTVGAVDSRGRLIARLGDRDSDFGESLAGIEVLSDALRGYLSDDVWGAGGKLQRVAAVPVLSKARDRVVGALWVGAETGKRLAEVWKTNLGVEIAILLRGQVVASTITESHLSDLPGRIEERRQQMQEKKRTLPIGLQVGSDRLLAVAAPFVGQAGEQGGVFALIRKVEPATDLLQLFDNANREDLGWSSFPWLRLLAALIFILGVGLFLQRREAEGPLRRLRLEVQRLARGDLHKLDDTVHPGKFGGIARDVNAAMERFTLAPAPRSESARKDVGAILGPAPTPAPVQPVSVFDLPSSHYDPLAPPVSTPAGIGAASVGNPFSSPPPPPPATLAPFMVPLPEPPPAREASPPRGYGGPPPVSGVNDLVAPPERPPFAPPFGGGSVRGSFTTPPPPPPPLPPAVALVSPVLTGISSPPALTSIGGELPAAEAAPWGVRERQATAVTGEPATSVSGSFAENGSALTTVGSTSGEAEEPEPAPAPPSAAPTSNGGAVDVNEEQAYAAHIREVFETYVATRRRCGETVATLTLDKFQARLETNRQQLMMKYACRGARFSVYIKDGKAAVKATPLR